MDTTKLICTEPAKAYFREMARRWDKTRATRMTAERFGVTPAAVRYAASFWM